MKGVTYFFYIKQHYKLHCCVMLSYIAIQLSEQRWPNVRFPLLRQLHWLPVRHRFNYRPTSC